LEENESNCHIIHHQPYKDLPGMKPGLWRNTDGSMSVFPRKCVACVDVILQECRRKKNWDPLR